jgi:HEAT repeats
MNTPAGEITQIVRRINDPDDVPCPLLSRNLLLRGTPKAVEGVISSLDRCAQHEAWYAVIDVLVTATTVPNSRFEAILDNRRSSVDLRHAAAHILSRRGVVRGHEVLFDEFPTRTLVRRFVDGGLEGIRTMCRAVPHGPLSSEEFVADRLAAQRRTTAPAIYALADDADSGADHVAVRVLGHWDEPRSVDMLLRIAEDPARRDEVREGAVEALCQLQAPEGIDVIGRALLDPDTTEALCEYYIHVLAEIGNYAAIEPLEAVAERDPDGWLGQCARDGIERIRSGE